MNTRTFLIGTFVLIVVLSISAFSWAAITKSQGSQPVDLTSRDAADVSAYRWNAIARFYTAQNESQGR
jgi:hypothetical protein